MPKVQFQSVGSSRKGQPWSRMVPFETPRDVDVGSTLRVNQTLETGTIRVIMVIMYEVLKPIRVVGTLDSDVVIEVGQGGAKRLANPTEVTRRG